MANNFVQVPPNSTGLKVDTTELTVGANTVERQNVCIADPATAANIAGVTAGGAVKVDGSAVTQPVSAASLPLPTGASTAAKQPALGTAGAASADVITVQGIASMTALKVDGSGVTQPVSGSVTANAGTGTFTVSGTVTANLAPATSGGCTDYHAVAAATTNAANIKASAGQIYTVSVFNNAAYPVYVKFYNTAGTPTAGTGVVHTVGVQAGTFATWSNPQGFAFSTGIGISITKGITDADATAVALSDCVVDVQYK